MRRIGTEGARAGMVLADAVRGPRGDVLLPAGIELTERHLHALRAWGVGALMIEGEESSGAAAPAGAAAELPEAALDAARAAVAPRFARCGTGHPVLAFLAEEAARRHAVAAPEPLE